MRQLSTGDDVQHGREHPRRTLGIYKLKRNEVPVFSVANGPIRPSSTQPTAMLLKNVAANLRCSFFAVLVDTTIALYFPFLV